MKSIILLSLLVCFSAFSQEKITGFVNNQVRSEPLLPLGKIDDYFYTVTPGTGISRIRSVNRELTSFLRFPEAVASMELLPVTSSIFITPSLTAAG